MKTYIATFHTHLSALMSNRNLTTLGVQAQMMPVPRSLSSSCGTCVRYNAADPNLSALDEDMEAVYECIGDKNYIPLMENK